MPTDKQLAANRANAGRSTCPRTPAGKTRSAQNARKHGFAGSDFAIVKIEDRDAVDRLRQDLMEVYQPVNSQELFAIERMALAQHNLLRLGRLEAGLCAVALNRALINLEDEQPFVPLHEDLKVDAEDIKVQNRYYCLAQGFHRMNVENSVTWSLFLRYQAQAERQYRRAVEDFERLVKLRPHLPPELPDDDSPNEPISDPQPEQNPDNSKPEIEPASAPESTILYTQERPGPLQVAGRFCGLRSTSALSCVSIRGHLSEQRAAVPSSRPEPPLKPAALSNCRPCGPSRPPAGLT